MWPAAKILSMLIHFLCNVNLKPRIHVLPTSQNLWGGNVSTALLFFYGNTHGLHSKLMLLFVSTHSLCTKEFTIPAVAVAKLCADAFQWSIWKEMFSSSASPPPPFLHHSYMAGVSEEDNLLKDICLKWWSLNDISQNPCMGRRGANLLFLVVPGRQSGNQQIRMGREKGRNILVLPRILTRALPALYRESPYSERKLALSCTQIISCNSSNVRPINLWCNKAHSPDSLGSKTGKSCCLLFLNFIQGSTGICSAEWAV